MKDIVYFSNVSENTHRLIQRVLAQNPDIKTHRIPVLYKPDTHIEVTNEYILFVPSYGSAATSHIPPQVKKFLNTHAEERKLCVGVVATGNLNFGHEFCVAGEIIAKKLTVPLHAKVDMAGDNEDVETILKTLEQDS